MHAADRLGKLFGRHVFQQVSGRSCFQGAAEIPSAGKGRKNNDAYESAAPFEFGSSLQAGHAGHLDVGNEDVGTGLLDHLQCFTTSAGASDYLDVALHVEQGSECPQHHGLVFGNDHADLVAFPTRHALSFAEQRRLRREANRLSGGFHWN